MKMSGPMGARGVRERADSMGEWCSRREGGGMRVFGIVLDCIVDCPAKDYAIKQSGSTVLPDGFTAF